jgi:putative nucleotidyltransferase with HDIG domain
LDQEYHLPRNTGLLVRDDSQTILYSSLRKESTLPANFFQQTIERNSGNFEFEWADESYLASFRWLFMEPKFLIPGFNITFIQPETDALLHTVEFNKIFPQVIALSLLVTVFLSIYFIRKNLAPLKVLKEGTHQIAVKNFNHRIKIASRDEFEELGNAFNLMSGQLQNQFYTLETSAQIIRSVLSSLDTQEILDTVISRMTDCFSCEDAGIGLLRSDQADEIDCYLADRQAEKEFQVVTHKLSPSDIKKLHKTADFLIIKQDQHLPDYLTILKRDGIDMYLVVPIFLKASLSALLMMSYRYAGALHEDCFRGRQMADQVAVALSNSRLLERLDRLNWGVLKALARAVDAKSSWTAGHSERVTQLTLQLADRLIRDPKERENLHRAALLHDIGKLGIQAAIIDKPGKLSEEEFKEIKSHPQIGARILEPIEEFKALIPVVLHHHERFDGNGYPEGLSGNAIPFGARILTVADVFDALISDRPYREGMPFERVIGIMREESGRQFDPLVVETLINTIYRKTPKAA